MKVKSSKPSSDMAPRGKSQGTEYVQKSNCTSVYTTDTNKKLSVNVNKVEKEGIL